MTNKNWFSTNENIQSLGFTFARILLDLLLLVSLLMELIYFTESDCCLRQCLRQFRGFVMHITDNSNQVCSSTSHFIPRIPYFIFWTPNLSNPLAIETADVSKRDMRLSSWYYGAANGWLYRLTSHPVDNSSNVHLGLIFVRCLKTAIGCR